MLLLLNNLIYLKGLHWKASGYTFFDFYTIYINHRTLQGWLLCYVQGSGIASLSVLAPGSMCAICYYEYFLQIYWVLCYAWCVCPTAIYLWFYILRAFLWSVQVEVKQSLMRWYATALLGWYYLHTVAMLYKDGKFRVKNEKLQPLS